MFIQDPGSELFPFRIPDPNFFSLQDPGSASKNFYQKSVLSEIESMLFIPDPDPDFYPSRIPESKRHRIPDLDPQH
jgi:hypothetical protein